MHIGPNNIQHFMNQEPLAKEEYRALRIIITKDLK